ncbi:hypothetical protein M422DRAFT_31828 [Sphaerobolus stellatus SS14]|uniref:Uncharacterized protein n=1 Tax=Sphaerobolus stellatus (strain SS14) TaxID=990650 RepID=A0A0C9V2G2_SPHS4|nr:hypothetical protein M422DRAFT_31828 [Sphaerobolus stellatus SS14]
MQPQANDKMHQHLRYKLRSHLRCDSVGHKLCLRDRFPATHREVNEEKFSIWVDALCEGNAMLSQPTDFLRLDSRPEPKASIFSTAQVFGPPLMVHTQIIPTDLVCLQESQGLDT